MAWKFPTKDRLHEIIFEADTPEGKAFDIALIIVILASLFVAIIETVSAVKIRYGRMLYSLEWVFTIAFIIEYLLRVYSTRKPRSYIFSFFGIVDLLSILPVFLSIVFVDSHSLIIIRSVRLLRIFRVLKLVNLILESMTLWRAIKKSQAKITVFLLFLVVHVLIFGSVMYLVEHNVNSGFENIPQSIYWAIVTLTTVGYGDVSPITPFGKFIASLVMISGYAVIAVPTGIITSEVIKAGAEKDISKASNTQACRYCLKDSHDADAKYCKYCGERMNEIAEKANDT